MKKTCRLCFYILFFIFFAFMYADEQGKAILIPQEVYIGDRAEIRYIFRDTPNLLEKELVFGTGDPLFAEWENNFTVESGSISFLGSEYTLNLQIVSWKPGVLDIPPFSVGPFIIDIPPVTVKSMLERTGRQTISPPAPPLIIPGTTYLIYGILFVSIILLILICILLSKGKKLVTSIRTSIFSFRRVKRFMKNMRRLEKIGTSINDRDFYSSISRNIRTYLDSRFMQSFSAATTAEIENKLCYFSGEEETDIIRSLCDICLRIDYIRFSENGLGEEKERIEMSIRLKELIPLFEISGVAEKKSGRPRKVIYNVPV